MAKVHVLDDELINKIAAGEVVERPASVVKELVENAMDAGAQHIKVILKDGGRQLIQVQDDGLGMEAADARLALKRHTTSKLNKADDLFQVTTMGFRGEALASISSVSRLTLQTQTRDAASGIRIVVDEGETRELAWQGPVGTSLTIADLFYNVPARKAFLKTGAAEFAACHEYMQALALSMPGLGFTLLHNDKEIFSVGALPLHDGWPRGEQPLRSRAQALFGEDLVQSLVYVQSADRYARVEGLISAPGQDKGSAKYLFTFVNQRWVRDKLLRYGILRGYHSHLLKGKFPIALLSIDIDAALVDVNVHPAKTELRFQYGNEVQNAIALTIREALRQKSWAEAPTAAAARVARPTESSVVSSGPLPADFDLLLGPQEPTPLPSPPASALGAELSKAGQSSASLNQSSSALTQDPLRRSSGASASPLLRSSAPASPGEKKPDAAWGNSGSGGSAKSRGGDGIKRTVMSFDAHESVPAAAPKAEARPPVYAPAAPAQAKTLPPRDLTSLIQESPKQPEVIPWDELQYIGAFARCFLLFEYKDQLLAVDQHAFHERVLYEHLAADPNLLSSTQPLLMPEVLEFSPSETAELKQEQDRFRQLGIHYEVISEAEIELRAVPSLLTNKDFSSLIFALLAGARSRKELSHDVLATIACHAAVRAGEDLPEGELKALLAQARTVDFYHNCPHGRRVFRWWKQSQVAAWFDRLS